MICTWISKEVHRANPERLALTLKKKKDRLDRKKEEES